MAVAPHLIGDPGDFVAVPVAAEEGKAILPGEPGQKAVHRGGQLPGLIVPLRAAGGGQHLLQLVQGQVEAAVALLGQAPPPAAQGTVAGDFAEVGQQRVRPPGRDAVPGGEPGVVHALLRLLRVGQDVLRHPAHRRAVFAPGLRDGLLRAGPIELQDLFVVQVFHVLSPRRSAHASHPLYYRFGKKCLTREGSFSENIPVGTSIARPPARGCAWQNGRPQVAPTGKLRLAS